LQEEVEERAQQMQGQLQDKVRGLGSEGSDLLKAQTKMAQWSEEPARTHDNSEDLEEAQHEAAAASKGQWKVKYGIQTGVAKFEGYRR
jgi:hypothetical protein